MIVRATSFSGSGLSKPPKNQAGPAFMACRRSSGSHGPRGPGRQGSVSPEREAITMPCPGPCSAQGSPSVPGPPILTPRIPRGSAL